MCCALLALACLVPLHADILINSNFAEGHLHWKGDAKDLDSPDLTSAPPPGIIIKLKKDKWTKIYQSFSTHETTFRFTITCQLSPDYDVGNVESSTSGFGTSDLADIPGVPANYPVTEGKWQVLLFCGGGGSGDTVSPDLKKADSQTVSGRIGISGRGEERVLAFAFPPGQGTITITNISLTPEDK